MKYIKCPNCSKFNLNKDVCSSCGSSLLITESRRQQQLVEREQALEKNKNAPKKGMERIYQNMKTQRLKPVRWLATGVKGIWLVFIGVTTLIALVLSVFAG